MKLSRFLRPGAGVLAAFFASPAFAQDDAGRTSEEEIVVTGTSLRGVAPAGANVIGLGEEEIEATGATTTTQVLSSIPQLLGFNSTPSIIATNSYRSSTLRPNIRNLDSGSISGGSSTLLLMDGHRLPGAGIQQTTPDSDVLPPSVIQRVEVVTDGGSSVYGSDAVGGVVNYITRRSFDGFQVDARQGFADEYQSTDVTLTAGEDWGSGSAYIAYNYLQHDAILGRDRDYIKRINWLTGETIDLTCSPANIMTGGAFYVNEPGFPAGPQTCDRSDNTSYIPQERKDSVFVGLSQDLSDSVRFDLRSFYTHRVDKGSIGSYLSETGAVTITPSNPYHLDTLSAGSQTVYFDYSALIGDSTVARNDLEVWGFTPELTVDLANDWQLRALLNYGASSTTTGNLSTGDMYDKHLSGGDLASAPKLRTTPEGTNYWEYQGAKSPTTGLNAVMGRVPEEYGMEPTSLDQMRRGCYDPMARLDDMNANGIAVSLNFATAVGIDGRLFHRAPDRTLAIKHMRAYNDWHVDEWCGAAPGRFIPCGLLPTWNMDAAVAEIKRLSAKGCKAVSINENPTEQGLPSIHNEYWSPFWKAIADANMTMCLHIGAGNPAPHASMETPIEAWISTMPLSVATGIADWLNLAVLQRYPLKIAMSEGGIGWVPALIERADFVHQHHRAWTHSNFGGRLPSEVFREHFLLCFIDDAYGLKNLESIGEDIVAYESDYPHSDSTWPNSVEILWSRLKSLSEDQIAKVTHLNAMRFFDFNPFEHHGREQLTVGALKAKAAAAKVDLTLKSFGGAKPLAAGEKRRVTSGDVMKMNANLSKQIEPVGDGA